MTASGFRFGLPDLNDGKPWTEMDKRDLKAALEHRHRTVQSDI
jgi:hypothetical protein